MTSPWWSPHRHTDRRPFLVARSRLMTMLRGWFAERDFLEVETGALQISPGNETHLHAFAAQWTAPDGGRVPLYLRTSPEFACKKLLAAGERRIVDFARVFRDRERGALHHPEFTLVEWYRAEEDYAVLMQDCADILAATADCLGVESFAFRGKRADPRAPLERLTVAEAFARHAGIDVLATLTGDEAEPNPRPFVEAATRAGIRTAADDTWSDVFSRVLVERIEPHLGIGAPTILYEYPVVQSALARPAAHDPRVAERFELYCCGVELANGFGELTDADEQRRRLTAEMDRKQELYGERYPLDEEFLAAVGCMPQASGVALGFERLVMLATGASHIEQVVWTPLPEEAAPASARTTP